MIDNYLLYLSYIENKLKKFFEAQSPYIFCKKGCALCCQSGEYPFSQIEFDFLMLGFSKLDENLKQQISDKINKLLKEKSKTDGTYLHECPFLINNECSVYNYRGIICRSFGLMSIRQNANSKIPFCAFKGLNYSNVLDPETRIISLEKFKALGVDKEPLAYNVGYNALTSPDIEEVFNIKFGEVKALIDWFDKV